MKRWVAITLLGAGVCLAQQEQTFERTLNVTGPVILDAFTDAGGIFVTPGPAGSVRVKGILKAQHGSFLFGDAESRIREIVANPPVRLSGNTVLAGHVGDKSLLRGVSMRLEIQVPPETQVKARADSGGIRVEGVKGAVDCKTDSGGIHATNISAEVRAQADSGGIHLRDIRGPVFARADSGGIEALEVAGAVDVQTDSGGIHVSQTVAAPIRAHADSGGANIRLAAQGGYDVDANSGSGGLSGPEMTVQGSFSRHHIKGKVRGGGPLVQVSADSGNVEIR